MRTVTTVLTTALLALAVVAPAQAAPTGPYRTDEQAAAYLEQTGVGTAFCINGHYSAHEKRTGRHFAGRKVVTRRGYVHYQFRSFACTVTDDIGTRQLYVQTRPGPWVVMVDR